MTKVNLEFVLTGAGWARLEIKGPEKRVIDPISYLSDALDDLLRMGLDIATDKGWSFAQFFHEPGSTILVAETGWWDGDKWEKGARLSAFSGEEYGGRAPTWRTLYEAERDFVFHLDSRDELARLFLDAATRVLNVYGSSGYRSRWNGQHGFPARALAAFKAALSDSPVIPTPS